jgi:glycogen phosphorylase
MNFSSSGPCNSTIPTPPFPLPWDQAWNISQQVFCYTNHTLLPEALERWPLPLFASVLPRHLEIIFEINILVLDDVRLKYPGDEARVARLSLTDESDERYVRMARLACIGSQAINGVAPRRFLVLSNPRLISLINAKIVSNWIKDLEELRRLEASAEDLAFHQAWQKVKLANKRELVAIILERTGLNVDPHSMFDIQVKRPPEYKRQHLDILHIITLYLRLKKDSAMDITPRTFIFGGKAAPGYFKAKLIIKLINSVAEMINRDPDIKD